MHKPNEEFEFTERDAAFERQLSAAMKRVDAPERLSVLLMNIAEAEQPKPAAAKAPEAHGFNFWRMPVPKLWMGGALAAALTLGVFGAEHIHHEHERAEATRQFDEAQQITDRALSHAREQLQRKGISLDEE